jgi:hypothetical protein
LKPQARPREDTLRASSRKAFPKGSHWKKGEVSSNSFSQSHYGSKESSRLQRRMGRLGKKIKKIKLLPTLQGKD